MMSSVVVFIFSHESLFGSVVRSCSWSQATQIAPIRTHASRHQQGSRRLGSAGAVTFMRMFGESQNAGVLKLGSRTDSSSRRWRIVKASPPPREDISGRSGTRQSHSVAAWLRR